MHINMGMIQAPSPNGQTCHPASSPPARHTWAASIGPQVYQPFGWY